MDSEQKSAIQAAIDRFNETGKVEEILYTGFDQTGKFIGFEDSNLQNAGRLKNQKLNPEDLVKTIDGKKILLSSFHNKGKRLVGIDYHEIRGQLQCPKTTSFHAPLLEIIGGHTNLDEASNIVLPQLKHLQGNLHADTVKTLDLPELKTVEHWETLELQSINAPKLEPIKYGVHTTPAKGMPRHMRLQAYYQAVCGCWNDSGENQWDDDITTREIRAVWNQQDQLAKNRKPLKPGERELNQRSIRESLRKILITRVKADLRIRRKIHELLSPKGKTSTMSPEEFQQAAAFRPSWAKKITKPIRVEGKCDMAGSKITHLSPHLHFAAPVQAEICASFIGCNALKIAEGTFTGHVDFSHSHIKSVGNLQVVIANKDGDRVNFIGCPNLILPKNWLARKDIQVDFFTRTRSIAAIGKKLIKAQPEIEI